MLIPPPKHLLNLFLPLLSLPLQRLGSSLSLSRTIVQTHDFLSGPIYLQCLPPQFIFYTGLSFQNYDLTYNHVPSLFESLHWLLVDDVTLHSIFHLYFPFVLHTPRPYNTLFYTSLSFHVWLYLCGMTFTLFALICFKILFSITSSNSFALFSRQSKLYFSLCFQDTLYLFNFIF